MPLVSVIVLNYRTPQETITCVQNVQKQTIADQIEIIVVENHSEDESIGVLRNRLQKYDNIRIIETPRNLGFGGGYDKGIAFAGGTYILINNPAKILQRDGIEKLVIAMEQDPAIGIIAPKLVHDDGTLRSSVRSFPTPLDVIIKRTPLRHLFPRRLAHYVHHDVDSQQKQNIDWVVGGCLMIRRDLFAEIGGFDKRFFLFFEDIDLCRRIHLKGKKVVYDPSVTATDRKRRLSGEGLWDLFFTKTGRIHVMSALKYFWKWHLTLIYPSSTLSAHHEHGPPQSSGTR